LTDHLNGAKTAVFSTSHVAGSGTSKPTLTATKLTQEKRKQRLQIAVTHSENKPSVTEAPCDVMDTSKCQKQ